MLRAVEGPLRFVFWSNSLAAGAGRMERGRIEDWETGTEAPAPAQIGDDGNLNQGSGSGAERREKNSKALHAAGICSRATQKDGRAW